MSLTDFDQPAEVTNSQTISGFLRPKICDEGVYSRSLKRPEDILLTLIILPVASLSIVILAAVLALSGTKPLYAQVRVGKNGKPFKMWKLRTMATNREHLLAIHLKEKKAALAEWNRHQKLSNDPRITIIGRWLRKTSLDELPQLWNVLVGDMSLVGPRPILPCQKPLYPGTDYYELRPGITGSWQVSARNTSSFADRANFDTDYSPSLSFSNDLKILLKTIYVVVRGTGC